MQTKTDAQLLREYARTGSETAFGELVSRHADLVYSAALRQVTEPDFARDVAQSVFTDLARKAKSLSDDVVLAGWLYRSTRFAALTFLRNERRRQNRERQAMHLLDPPGESSSDWDRIRPLLDEAMANLGDTDRDALVLRYFKNEDLRAVGIALGTSEDAAQKRVTRALEKLRAFLLRRGVTLSSAALASALTGSAVQAAPAALAGTISTAVIAGGAAATAGSAFDFLNLMSMTKLKAGLLSAAIVVGAGTPILVQQQSVSRLRAENRYLRAQSQELERLRSDNQQLAGLRVEAEELERLRKEVSELHRLRAEVARLRRERERTAERPPMNPSNQTNQHKPASDAGRASAASGYEKYLQQVMESGTLEQQGKSAWHIVDALRHGFGLSPTQMDFLSAVKARLEGGTLSTDDFVTFQTALLCAAINLQEGSTKQQVEEMVRDGFGEVAAKGLKPEPAERREIDRKVAASIRRLLSAELQQAFDERIESVLEFKLVDWALAMGQLLQQQRATTDTAGDSIR